MQWAMQRLQAYKYHCCDYVAAQNRTSQAKFKCVQCGYENHADVVGAMNVLARGYRVIACGDHA
jgi:putative transposase